MKQAGRKNGRLSHGHKEPPSYGGGLDWGQIERQFQERLQQDIDNGVDDIMTRAELRRREGLPPLPKPATRRFTPDRDAQRRGGLRTGPRFDADKMVEMYEAGSRVREIAEATGANPRTVRYWLTRRGVYDPKRDKSGGPAIGGTNKPKERCQNDHPLDVYGVQKYKSDGKTKNGRDCSICIAERNRNWRRRAKVNGK